MLKLITRDGSTVPLKVDDYCIKELATGLDELIFSISIFDETYPLIQEECRILADETQWFLVKAIDGGGDKASVKCIIDLDDWKKTVTLNYTTQRKVTFTTSRKYASISSNGTWAADNTAYSIVFPISEGKIYDVRWNAADKKLVGDVFYAGQATSATPGQTLTGVVYSSPMQRPKVVFTASRGYYVIEVDAAKAPDCFSYLSVVMRGNMTPAEIITEILPDGWTMTDSSGITSTAVLELSGVTPYDILEACRTGFDGLTFRFDNINKTLTLLNVYGGANVGAFVTRDLNLKQNDYKGKSTDFATRLYAYGKDGLSFSAINDNKAYVEDFTYTDKVVCACWTDEQYDTASKLLAAAQERVSALAVPKRSYTCDVVDLAAVDPAKYSFLSFPLFSVCALIDDTRALTKINHVVMERWNYPLLPAKNKVVLSTVAPRIQTQVAGLSKSLSSQNSEYQQQQRAVMNTLTSILLGAKGGSVRLVDTDGDGTPDELYIADSADPAQAKRVWRFNYLGWGASTNGYEGPFNMGATFENGGTLYANYLNVSGAYKILKEDGTTAGFLGLGKGNDGVSDTWGVALCGPGSNPSDMTSATNYVIITNSGARMQAGGHEVYVTSSGAYYDDYEIITQKWVTNTYAPEIQAIWQAIANIGS